MKISFFRILTLNSKSVSNSASNDAKINKFRKNKFSAILGSLRAIARKPRSSGLGDIDGTSMGESAVYGVFYKAIRFSRFSFSKQR
jgi:hypothetical protein